MSQLSVIMVGIIGVIFLYYSKDSSTVNIDWPTYPGKVIQIKDTTWVGDRSREATAPPTYKKAAYYFEYYINADTLNSISRLEGKEWVVDNIIDQHRWIKGSSTKVYVNPNNKLIATIIREDGSMDSLTFFGFCFFWLLIIGGTINILIKQLTK